MNDISTDTLQRYVEFHWYEAIRGNLGSQFKKEGKTDPEEKICSANDASNCWRFSLWNGNFYYGDKYSGTRNTYHYNGNTASFTTGISRTYSDGTKIASGLVNWWMTERVLYNQFSSAITYNAEYYTCCRQYSGVRNGGGAFRLKATVNLAQVANGITQNPHCSSAPIYYWPFSSSQTITSHLSLNTLCNTPFDSAPTWAFSTYANSGLYYNGGNLHSKYTSATLTTAGIMTWAPNHDGLYAMQFTVTDKYGNSNILDIIFDVTESSNSLPYFVEVRNSIGGANPTSTTAIFGPATQTASVGSSLTLGVWAYAPSGTMSEITYTFTNLINSVVSHTCVAGTTQYCELQFQFTPVLGLGDGSLCLIAHSSVGSYIGAPNDPSGEVSFCIPVVISTLDFIYLSGTIRDFRSNEAADTGIPYANSGDVSDTNFIKGDLTASLRPQYDTSVSPTTCSQSKFAYWFEDSAKSESVTTSIALSLHSGSAGADGSVYQADLNPWYPVDCAGYDAALTCDGSVNNKFFTYEVTTYFTYVSGLKIQFKTIDYLWVFVDGKQVLANTQIKASPSTLELDFDSLTLTNPVTPGETLSLTSGSSYTLSLFFVHLSTYTPALLWQIPGGSICDAVSNGNTTVSLSSFASSDLYDTQGGGGMVGITASLDLRVVSGTTTSSSAVWYASAGVAQRFDVTDGFQTTFEFEIDGCSSGCVGSGVPGFAFVVQAEGSTARGGAAAGLGYEGITSAIAVEFDGTTDSSKGDPSYSHVSYHYSSAAGSSVTASEVESPQSYSADAVAMTRGLSHNITITYNPGQYPTGSSTRVGWIYVYVDGAITPALAYEVTNTDIAYLASGAYVGFTGGTSSTDASIITIKSWTFKVVTPSATLTTWDSKTTAGTAGQAITGNVVHSKDACGNTMSTGGNSGLFSASVVGDDATNVAVTVRDYNNGKYGFEFTPTKSQKYTLTVLYGGSPINSGDNTVVNIGVSASSTISTTKSQVANMTGSNNVNANNTFWVVLRDSFGNLIEEDLVLNEFPTCSISVTADPTTITPNPGYVIIQQNSSYAYEIVWMTPQSAVAGYTVRVTASGSDVTGGGGSPQTVIINAGPLSIANCKLDTANPPATSVAADFVGTFYILIADAGDNRIVAYPQGYTVNYTVTSATGDTGCTVCSTCAWDGATSAFKCTYVRTIAGTHIITPRIFQNGNVLGNVPNANFTLTVIAKTDSATSALSPATAASLTVGDTRTIFIQAKDQYGNVRTVANEAGTFTVESSPALATNPTPTYQHSGIYSFSYRVTDAEKYASITITVKWEGATIASGAVTDTWASGAVASLTIPAALGNAIGTNNTFILGVKDAFGNKATSDQTSSVSVRVALPSSATYGAWLFFDSVSKNHTVIWRTEASGQHTLSFFANQASQGSSSVTVAPGPVSGGAVVSSDDGWAASQRVDDKPWFRVVARDQYGNNLDSADTGSSAFTLEVTAGNGCSGESGTTYNPTSAPAPSNGIYQFNYTVNCAAGSFYVLTVKFSGTSIATTTLEALIASSINGYSLVHGGVGQFGSMVSDVDHRFFILSKDNAGANRTDKTANQAFTFGFEVISLTYYTGTYNPTAPTVNPNGVSPLVPVNNFSLSYAGTYKLHIYDKLELAESKDLGGYSVTVGPGPPSRYLSGQSQSFASNVEYKGSALGDGIAITAGGSYALKITLRDQYSQTVTDNTQNVWATVTYSGGATPKNITGTFSASASAWYVNSSETTAGAHVFTIRAGSVTVGQTTYSLRVSPGVAVGRNSDLAASTAQVKAGSQVQYTVSFRDSYNNSAAAPDKTATNITLSNSGLTLVVQDTNSVLTYPDACKDSTFNHFTCFQVSLAPTVAENFTAIGFANGSPLRNTRFLQVLNSDTIGTVLATQSNVTGFVNLTAGDAPTFYLHVRDEFGNPFQFRTLVQLQSLRVSIVTPTGTGSLTTSSGATYLTNGQWKLNPTGCGVGAEACPGCLTCVVGTYIYSFLYGTFNILGGSTRTLTVSHNTPYHTKVAYTYSPDQSNATNSKVGFIFSGISFQTFDYYGNKITSASQPSTTVELSIWSATPSACAVVGDQGVSNTPEASFTQVNMTYVGAGVYRPYFRGTSTGTFLVVVSVGGNYVCGYYATITLDVGVFHPNSTSVSGLTAITTGTSRVATMSFADQYGNSVPADNHTLVQISGMRNFTLSTPYTSWFQTSAGIWWTRLNATQVLHVTYSTTTTGNFTAVVTVAGTTLAKSHAIEVGTGTVSNFTMGAFGSLRASRAYTVTIQALDEFNNKITSSDHTTRLEFTKVTGATYKATATTTQTVSGISTHRFVLYRSGTFVPSVTIINAAGTTVVDGKQVAVVVVDPSVCGASDPSKPYRCANGTCVADHSACSGVTCSGSTPVQCYDGSCVASTATATCACPSGKVRCPSGACQAAGTCHAQPLCASGTQQCSVGGIKVCRQSTSDCPSPSVCLPGWVLCPDGISCATSAGQCQDFSRDGAVNCSNVALRRCADGTCARTLDDCATRVTCSSSGHVVCPDGTCAASPSQCTDQYECAASLTNTFRCQDGSCRPSAGDCPSGTVCPPTHVLCESGACAATLSACAAGLTCAANETRCPDGSCSSEHSNCPAAPTCGASTPVRCPDGVCEAVQSDCRDPNACTSGIRCPGGACVTASSQCPTQRTCGESWPVLCADGGCARNRSECSAGIGCLSSEVRCPGGLCRVSLSQCPTFPTCTSEYPVLCPDRSCRVAVDKCIDAVSIVCPANTVRCPSGACAAALALCETPITCDVASGYARCVDGTCRKTCPDYSGDSPTPCAENQIQCPQSGIGFTCVSATSFTDCPQGVSCPASRPVRCVDMTCVEKATDCPAPPASWSSTRVACADGSYESSIDSCGADVTCLDSAPFKCWDATCRASPEDCPAGPTCSSGKFRCPNGDCKDSPWLCRSIASCATAAAPVRCPVATDACQATKSICTDPYSSSLFAGGEVTVCAPTLKRCRDGHCGTASSCTSMTCPGYLPTLCDNGVCASSTAACAQANGCPASDPVRCWDGSCAATASACPAQSNATCERGYRGDAASLVCSGGTCTLGQDTSLTSVSGCADGSCNADGKDLSKCTGYDATTARNGSETGCATSEVLCADRTCQTSTSKCSAAYEGANTCPANRPHRCAAGLCALGSQYCPSVPGESTCAAGLVRCYSGECVADLSQCSLIKPCFGTNVRCADGTCRAEAADCPVHNPCPTNFGYRCPDNGVCAASAADCIIESNGCPGSAATRCVSGACVSDASLCSNYNVSGTGCAQNNLIKCWNGECVASPYACPASNGCPASTPLRCNDGACVADTSACSASTTCATVTCADGSCAASQSACSTAFECNMTHPFRCADGTCASGDVLASILAGGSGCSAAVVCADNQVVCADGSCAGSSALCPSQVICSGSTPYLCSDFVCAADVASCPSNTLYCPPANPTLCSTGACVSTPSVCTSSTPACSDSAKPVSCFDGACVSSQAECVALGVAASPSGAPRSRLFFVRGRAHLASSIQGAAVVSLLSVGTDVSSACNGNSSLYMCPNGQCVERAYRELRCDAVASCTNDDPFRCPNSTCTPATTQAGCAAYTCASGLSICEDGTCRSSSSECFAHHGCPTGYYLCVESRECVTDASTCTNNTLTYRTTYTQSPRLEEIGICKSSCHRDLLAETLITTVDPNTATTVNVIDHDELGTAVVLSLPAGIFNRSDANAAYIFTKGAAASELRQYNNYARREVQSVNLGVFVVPFGVTLLSAPFKCWVSDNVNAWNLNVTVTAYIDRTYPHVADDVCLATVSSSTGDWRCVYYNIADRAAHPVALTDKVVSSSFNGCAKVGSETGKVYAFIYNPIPRSTETNDSSLSAMQQNWVYIAMGVIGGSLLLVYLVYYVSRQMRYRRKYKEAQKKLEEKKIELQRMQQVGAGAANIGARQDFAMEKSPLQLQIADINALQAQLPPTEERKKMFAQEEEVKAKRAAYISRLEQERKKLEEVVSGLRRELEIGERRPTTDSI